MGVQACSKGVLFATMRFHERAKILIIDEGETEPICPFPASVDPRMVGCEVFTVLSGSGIFQGGDLLADRALSRRVGAAVFAAPGAAKAAPTQGARRKVSFVDTQSGSGEGRAGSDDGGATATGCGRRPRGESSPTFERGDGSRPPPLGARFPTTHRPVGQIWRRARVIVANGLARTSRRRHVRILPCRELAKRPSEPWGAVRQRDASAGALYCQAPGGWASHGMRSLRPTEFRNH